VKLYKNFLKDEDFNILKQNLTLPFFPWYLNEGVAYKNDGFTGLMTHNFFDNEKNYVNSNYYNLLEQLLIKINPLILFRIKANLMFPTETNIQTPFHIDILKAENFKSYTGIYYVNTNDGYTLFEDGTKNHSVENTYLEFDGKIKHASVTHTNTPNRIVINFNYLKQ
tara:strand:+ start:325 stop:825 length:501 start_codon:yes stop_codon:yes gene_type:complete